MDKMDGMTMNIEKANVEKLKAVFPEVFADGKVDFDKLQGLLGHYIADDKEKYSFSWKGKADSLRLAQKRSTGTLRPCKEESKDWDTTENLYIEGDNLEVLKLLQSSYLNSIKMIYIDPPYNTGNDFVYTDDFADGIAHYKEVTGQATKSNPETAGRYHTNWLNMMYPRLKLARNLLTDDGVIFMSISDAEFHNLKKIADEIFGEMNYCGDIIWNSTKSVTNTALISVSHTYNLVYFKNMDYFVENREVFRLPDDGEGFENPDNDPRGPWKADPFQVGGWRPNQQYEIINPNTGVAYRPNAGCSWKNDYQKFQELLRDNRIVFGKTGEGGPQRKRFIWEAQERGKVSKTLWDDVETTTNGTQMIKKMFDGVSVFDNPKPVGFIKRLLQLGSSRDSIILDFFSGSATTAHAVMQLNAEDGGHRKFICVQLPEKTDEQSEAYKAGYKTICEIGKERIRRAGEKIKEEIEKYNNRKGTITRGDDGKVKHLSIWGEFSISGKDINIDEYIKDKPYVDIGFKVFKLDSSNLVKWDNTPTTDEEEVKKRIQQSLFYLVEGREDLDLVYEIMLKYGLSLTLPVEERKFDGVTAYIINHPDYKVLICLQPNITISAVEEMDKETIGTYIFADRCFADANILSNTEEILKKKDKEMRLF